MPNFNFTQFLKDWNNFNPNIEISLKDNQPPKKISDLVVCHCKLCGGTFENTPSNLKASIRRNSKTKGCRICSGQEIQKGVNDFATLHPECMKYIVNPDDVANIASSTFGGKKFLCKCDKCNYQEKKRVYDLIRYGFCCPKCSTGVSSPNRFIRTLISQLPVENISFEYRSKWTQGKYYDCYFEYNNKKYVIEMDGSQHFRDAWYITKEKQAENDKTKNKLAEENNVTMIRIDCKDTDYNYLYNKVNNSLLSQLFNLSTIDWNKCKDALKNDLLIKVCEYFNEYKNSGLTNKQIANYFNISTSSVARYLNKGNQLGLCKYNWEEYTSNSIKKAVGKTQLVYDLEGNFIGKYQTITELTKIFPEITKSDTNKISYAQNHGQNKVKIKNYYFERV